MTVDAAAMERIAAGCVALVADQFDRRLDWTVDSLAGLDAVCAELLSDGPLPDERLDLWWRLVGAYTGEVLIRAYGGRWVRHDSSPDVPAVSIRGTTAFPFTIAGRVLRGEPYKSLASFGRAAPAVFDRAQQPE